MSEKVGGNSTKKEEKRGLEDRRKILEADIKSLEVKRSRSSIEDQRLRSSRAQLEEIIKLLKKYN